MPIRDNQPYQRNPHTAWQVMDEGGMILHLQAQELTAVNSTGAALWQALTAPRTAPELAATLAQDFAVTPEEALPTVRAFLEQLVAKDLIAPAPPQP
jgi:hypothetical protein